MILALPRSSSARARAARAALVALLVCAAARATAAELEVSWDKDLAFERDRANYEKTLHQLVAQADAEASSWLGWSRTRPLAVRVMTRPHYEAEFGTALAAGSGAHYSRRGVINVNGGARFDAWFAGALAHEMTHAYLDDRRTGGRLPQWLNEGLATRVELRRRGQDALDTTQVTQLEVALQHRQLLPLPAGGGMTPYRYLQAFAAVLFLEKKIGKDALMAIVRRTLNEGTFEQALDAELRWTMRNVEEGFAYWVDHLQ
jgi:hypothetical protein